MTRTGCRGEIDKSPGRWRSLGSVAGGRQVIDVPGDGLLDAGPEVDARRPAQPPQARDIQELAWHAVGLRTVPRGATCEACGVRDQGSELPDAEVRARAHVDVLVAVVDVEEVQTGRCHVVHVQEL